MNTVALRTVAIVVSIFQFIGLLMQYPRIKWLSLYVPMLEAALYFAAIIVPNAGYIQLTNGVDVPLMKFCGWLVTVPVLLLQLCRLPYSFANRGEKTSGLVVANQLMLTFGIGSEALGQTIAGVTLFLISFIIGLYLYWRVFEIYKICINEIKEGNQFNRHRLILKVLFFVFYLSWSLFPFAQFLKSILGVITRDQDLVIHVIADLLSKNTYGILLYYYIWKLKPDIAKENNVINDGMSVLSDESNVQPVQTNNFKRRVRPPPQPDPQTPQLREEVIKNTIPPSSPNGFHNLWNQRDQQIQVQLEVNEIPTEKDENIRRITFEDNQNREIKPNMMKMMSNYYPFYGNPNSHNHITT